MASSSTAAASNLGARYYVDPPVAQPAPSADDILTTLNVRRKWAVVTSSGYPDEACTHELGTFLCWDERSRTLRFDEPVAKKKANPATGKPHDVDYSYVAGVPLTIYRLLCLFPGQDVLAFLDREGYDHGWDAHLMHRASRTFLYFSEEDGHLCVFVSGPPRSRRGDPDKRPSDLLSADVSADVLQLLALLCSDQVISHPSGAVVAGSAISASVAPPLLGPPLRFPVYAPRETPREYRYQRNEDQIDADWEVALQWEIETAAALAPLPAASSSFMWRGTQPIEHAISSPLLLYRLLVLFVFGTRPNRGEPSFPANPDSVWRIDLHHRASGGTVIFADVRGAVRIQLTNFSNELNIAANALIDLLCSDHCPHTANGGLAGSTR